MNEDLIEILSIFRTVVGYLGEKDQFGWWQSSFFTQGSSAFLSPVFSRTQILAQCNGVTRAAALVHDERIGVGNVYHLFRLPEELEQGIHQALHEARLVETIQNNIANKDSALNLLRNNSIASDHPNDGPMRVGSYEVLRDKKIWSVVAGLYLFSFETQREILPYFTNLI